MFRLSFTIIATFAFGTSFAQPASSVADLVRQLGDPKFAVRQAAQKGSITSGEIRMKVTTPSTPRPVAK